MWRHYRPEDLTNLQAFREDPKLVWDWHDWRRQLIAAAKPSVAHRCIAKLEGLFEDFFLITQTIDDIHRVAGNKNILELDGNIWTTKCMKCGAVHENREVPLKTIPPICPDCGSIERPNVIWFGDLVDDAIIDIAWDKAAKADVMMTFGVGGGIQPMVGISSSAIGHGAYVFDINIDKTPLTFTAHFATEKNCGVVLTEIIKLIESFRR
jgi:NAD-dependent deacetylase